MDRFISTALGGIPEAWDDLRWYLGQANNQGIYQALNNLLGAFGTNFVVQGCEVSGAAPNQSMTEGWIILGGELLKVDAIASGLDTTTDYTFTKDNSVFDSTGDKDLKNGVTGVQTYNKIRGVLSGGAGTLNVLTGDRFKDQYDNYKTFDVTGTAGNFVCNENASGTGSDRPFFSGAASSSFRYNIVGKTVYWHINIENFIINSQDTLGSPIFSLIFRNLPWTAKVKQVNTVYLEGITSTGSVSNHARLIQEAGSNRMRVVQAVFDDSPVALNRFYTWFDSTSMDERNTLVTNLTAGWTLTGSGTFEIT